MELKKGVAFWLALLHYNSDGADIISLTRVLTYACRWGGDFGVIVSTLGITVIQQTLVGKNVGGVKTLVDLGSRKNLVGFLD